VETSWKPIVAGIINIAVGVFTLLGMFIIAIILVGISGSLLAISRIVDLMPIWLSGFAQFVIVIVAIFLLIVSALPLIGGICSLERKNWRWALTGSIIAILSSAILGIASTVLILLSKNEFQRTNRFLY